MGPAFESAQPFLDALYIELLRRGIQYFVPSVHLEHVGEGASHSGIIEFQKGESGATLSWLGQKFGLSNSGSALTAGEARLLKSIGRVLSARYSFLFNRDLASQSFELFRGLPEDRYVSAFLDPAPYRGVEERLEMPDRIADAIEVLRISALTTYENRRIVTGALLFGAQADPCHVAPPKPAGALPYSTLLTPIRSFHRLCDGLQTLALVNEDGLLVDLVDVQEWTHPYVNFQLPVPGAARYETHCRATLCGGHICLVLTPHGEIKIFSAGAQVFNFIDGRWRLTDAVAKFQQWEEALGNQRLADRLYRVALNLAEERRGGLFVVLDESDFASTLVAPGDLLGVHAVPDQVRRTGTKDQLHYLLRGRSLENLPATVLESVARIDGGIVMDQRFNLLAFGAILRLPSSTAGPGGIIEGGRTTAAIAASHFGHVLKISEDGLISYYRKGHCVWEM